MEDIITKRCSACGSVATCWGVHAKLSSVTPAHFHNLMDGWCNETLFILFLALVVTNSPPATPSPRNNTLQRYCGASETAACFWKQGENIALNDIIKHAAALIERNLCQWSYINSSACRLTAVSTHAMLRSQAVGHLSSDSAPVLDV